MLNHGLSTAAMFLVVGFMIRRRGSQHIDAFGGVQKVAPVLAGVLLISGLAALALPGMGSFVSEFLVMAGAWQAYPVHTAVITLGMVLAAVYVLRMYKTHHDRPGHGPGRHPRHTRPQRSREGRRGSAPHPAHRLRLRPEAGAGDG